jgi:mono/diheme cytochrome c family protein
MKATKLQKAGWGLIAAALASAFAVSWPGHVSGEPGATQDDPDTSPNARGAAIYQKQCAECHGEHGQGVVGAYEKPLAGERSVPWLTRRVERTMPEGEADQCVGEDASAVARYIHEQFYEPSQRQANDDARYEVQHLTVEQHRQSLADLIGSFRKPVDFGEARGLSAVYYPGRDMRKNKPIAERIDPTADAVFTRDHPLHDKFDEKGHSVRWSGSLLAPQTGEYEIVVRTDQALRLWLNDGKARGGGIRSEFGETESAFIDGWVQSEDKEEFRKRVYLVAGRAYPLLLEFSAHTQGVGQKDPHKTKADERSYLSLRWVMPGQAEQVIAEHFLSPVRGPEVFVCSTAFPADDASRGYERGVGVSPAWLDATTGAAVQTADHVIEHFQEFTGNRIEDDGARAAAMAFCKRFVERASRRPMSEAEQQQRVAPLFESAPDVETAVRRVVISTLISPRFLYPDADPQLIGGYAVASRLALSLWDGMPDDALLAAAAKGELQDRQRVLEHATRMSHDPRAEAKLMRFFHHWLELSRAEYASKDSELFPEFDKALLTDLRTSLDLFLEDAVFGERSDYRALLLADYLYVNERMAEVYGIDRGSAEPGFVKVSLDARRRSGVITHPYLLSAFAYHDNTSPIHRGVFLTRNVIGRRLAPPPNAVAFTDAEFDPSLTMREKVTVLTRDQACMACHATINPLGFSLEHYDSIGRWRQTEKDKPIDPASDFVDDQGQTIRLKGARDVAEFAAASDLARRGFVRQLFEHTAHRDPAALGPDTLDALDRAFESQGTHVRKLFAHIGAGVGIHALSLKQAADDDDQAQETDR